MFPKEMHCLWGYLYAHLINSLLEAVTQYVSKSSWTTNFNKEEKLLMAALGKEFPEAKKI